MLNESRNEGKMQKYMVNCCDLLRIIWIIIDELLHDGMHCN